MKTLQITLQKKWFDMTDSGEKKEEYRDIKMYWASRLMNGFPSTFGIELLNPDFKTFDFVHAVNGYGKNKPSWTRQCLGISIGEGNPEWGAEIGKQYFIIKLGNKISNPNQQHGKD